MLIGGSTQMSLWVIGLLNLSPKLFQSFGAMKFSILFWIGHNSVYWIHLKISFGLVFFNFQVIWIKEIWKFLISEEAFEPNVTIC